jgi:hypothetical protein
MERFRRSAHAVIMADFLKNICKIKQPFHVMYLENNYPKGGTASESKNWTMGVKTAYLLCHNA